MSRYTNSPHSSLRDESIQGTPQTTLTAFSPEDARGFKVTLTRSSERPQQAGHADPFVSVSKTKQDQKLSATASSFQPFGLRVRSTAPASTSTSASRPIPGTTQYLDAVIEKENSPARSTQEIEPTQFGTFTTSTLLSRTIKIASVYKTDVMPLVQASWKKLTQSGVKMRGSYKFKDLGDVVYVRLANIVDAPVLYNNLSKHHNDLAIEYVSSNVASQVFSPEKDFCSAHEGQVVLRVKYPVSRTSTKGQFERSMRDLLAVEGPICAWQKMAATEAGTFHMVAEFEDCAHAGRAINRLNGKQVGDVSDTSIISLTDHTPDAPSNAVHQRTASATTPTRRSGLAGDTSNLAEAMGSMSINTGSTPQYTQMGSYAASMSSPAAFLPTNAGFGFPQPAVLGMGAMYSPPQLGPQYSQNAFSPFTPTHFQHQAYAQGSVVPYGPRYGGLHQRNPMGDSRYVDDMMAIGGYRGDNLYARGGRHVTQFGRPVGMRNRGNQASGQHNHVDIERIEAGIDVRTTVMLRNIPNKVDQQMLKEIIDESSFGRYDFMYLRIDFSNNCNVGYAFINFVDPLDIIKFVEARSNQRWQRFKSDKVAEVSYATIQGRDCLIQKFRNSSVMLEPSHYRPKLFYTLQNGSQLAGQEEDFPSSDNASKLKRSCENAEHVGLFAPSAGQHLRDEQRRRRSQYDRGTSLAERDEYYEENQFLGYGPY